MTARAVALRTFGRTRLELFLGPGVLLLSIGVGVSLVSWPMLAFLPVAALGGALLLVDGRARALFVIFGGFFVFQRPGGLDSLKLAFLGGLVIVFAAALLNARTLRSSETFRVARPLLPASVAFLALVALSLPVAHANGTPGADWLRDVAPFVLFGCVPILALDARASFSTRGLVRMLVAAGLLGAAAFTIGWLNRRGIAYLQVDRVALASLFVPAALFAFAMSATLQARLRRTRWLLLAALVLAPLVATGTRTTLALLLAPLAIAVGARRQLAARSFRLVLLAPVAVGVTALFGVFVLATTGASTEQLNQRISILRASGDTTEDGSYNDRIEQSRVAWEVFESKPIFGAGPGMLFEWRQQGIGLRADSILDTPLTFPAKFGALGVVILLWLIIAYARLIRNLAVRLQPSVVRLALLGYLAVVAGLSVFAPPFEDKGFAFALILLLSLALAEFPVGPRERSGCIADAPASGLGG